MSANGGSVSIAGILAITRQTGRRRSAAELYRDYDYVRAECELAVNCNCRPPLCA